MAILWPHTAEALKPLGDAFIALVRMLIAPVIFCTVVTGIAGMQRLRDIGRTGALALLYFELLTTVALLVGLLVVNLVQPGAGLDVDPATLDPAAVAAYTRPGQLPGVVAYLLNIIPTTFLGAFASGDTLQVLLVAILFGFALHAAGGRDSPVFRALEQLTRVFFAMVGFVMRLAPLGAFGAMAYSISRLGTGALWSLGKLLLCFYLTCLIFVLLVLGLVARMHGFSILRFIRYIRDEIVLVIGTSESVLPRMIAKLGALGVRKPVVGLVIPTGYSFNLDGTSIYLTMAAVFVAQATDTPLDIAHQLGLLLVLLLASKGAAGVTGSGFIVLAAALAAVGPVPAAGLALILGIDRFMSEARALTNLIGNGVATIVVGKWCRQLDETRLRSILGTGHPVAGAGDGEGLADP